MNKIRTTGFTLIELLIVVAIIAILAAIAVPNFLQAQVRTKVSRAMADMRTVAVGIKSYEVDHNHYPLAGEQLGEGGGFSNTPIVYRDNSWVIDYLMVQDDPVIHMGTLMTTPIAYLTDIPYDEFNSKSLRGSTWNPIGRQWSYVFSGVPVGGPREFYRELRRSLRIQNHWDWYLESVGPDLLWIGAKAGYGGYESFYYDPTNGTISSGQLIYFDSGITIPKF